MMSVAAAGTTDIVAGILLPTFCPLAAAVDDGEDGLPDALLLLGKSTASSPPCFCQSHKC